MVAWVDRGVPRGADGLWLSTQPPAWRLARPGRDDELQPRLPGAPSSTGCTRASPPHPGRHHFESTWSNLTAWPPPPIRGQFDSDDGEDTIV
ncbi:hypothetical protein SPBR_01136 [Sporothrix brasiliensis 5110]|uniref:Uncharacterized protein n=1 Tax=Sporothrix brasiliensis 5110 TaxID=1398154 RepID=A0A0C2IVV1_9PEZI|nr:uncharacterized protein SPBR_01136 [Sporothrix brasiliensis 5110]KIH90920.1 hypothetical protein SPBR_01136 [Sporothrix brasiliensis 5110]